MGASSHVRKAGLRALLDCGCEVALSRPQFRRYENGHRVNIGCGVHRRTSHVVRSLAGATLDRTK